MMHGNSNKKKIQRS